MKLRYKPLDLIDSLWRRGIASELRLGRVAIPELNWYFDLATANLCEVTEGTPDKVLITLLVRDSAEVVAYYIASLQAAIRKGLVA